MKLIIKKRQSGKTTGLIYTSEATGFSIITPTKSNATLLKNMAQNMGCNIPPVYTVDEVLHTSRPDKTKENQFLLDDADQILDKALEAYLGCRLFAATISDTQPQTEEKFTADDIGREYNMVESDYADNVTSAKLSSQLDIEDDEDIELLLLNNGSIKG